MKHNAYWTLVIVNVRAFYLIYKPGNSRSYFSKWDFEHLEKALFWMTRGKSLPLRHTRFRTSTIRSTRFFQQTAWTFSSEVDDRWAIKEAKQKPVIKASWPARCPLKRSWRGDSMIDITWLASKLTTWLSSFRLRFLVFFCSSSRTAR